MTEPVYGLGRSALLFLDWSLIACLIGETSHPSFAFSHRDVAPKMRSAMQRSEFRADGREHLRAPPGESQEGHGLLTPGMGKVQHSRSYTVSKYRGRERLSPSPPPNPVCAFSATGSPVSCFVIGIDAPIYGLRPS